MTVNSKEENYKDFCLDFVQEFSLWTAKCTQRKQLHFHTNTQADRLWIIILVVWLLFNPEYNLVRGRRMASLEYKRFKKMREIVRTLPYGTAIYLCLASCVCFL